MNNQNTQDCNFLKRARNFKENSRAEKKKAWENKKRSTNEKPKEQMYNMKDIKSMMGKFASKWRKAKQEENKRKEEVQILSDNDTAEFFQSDASSDSESEASCHSITESDKDLINDVTDE